MGLSTGQGRDTVVAYSPDIVYEFSDSDRADRMQRMQSLTAIRSLAVRALFRLDLLI